jgi:nucleoside-diphosphate-sugar epimerase
LSNVVVTGGAGFLGSNLVDLLLAGRSQVMVIDNLVTGRQANLTHALRNPRFSFRQADITRVRRLPRAERYYHLASPASPPAYGRDPIGTLLVNSAGTHRVLEAARRSDARVLIASTSEVYGDPEVHPQSERYWGHVNPVGVRGCYDEGKRYAEALAIAYRRRHGLDVRIARIFNTYGPRMDPNDGRMVANFIVQGLRGEPFTIHGQGKQTRSFCYVSDLVQGLHLMMEAAPGIPTPMNLGNPREFTVRRAAEIVAQAVGTQPRFEFHPLPEDDPKQRSPDIRLARKYLGWSPRVPFEKGLSMTVAYFRSLGIGRANSP